MRDVVQMLPLGEMQIAPCALAGTESIRSDGIEARSRLLKAALGLFAEKGFAKTSVREIAQAAQVNAASISYYFGGKAGLYRAVWTNVRCIHDCDFVRDANTSIALPDALRCIFQSFVEPLKQSVLSQHSTKLFFREMLEPAGVWKQEIENKIKPSHMALVQLLCRHLNVVTPDDDIHRLAFSIAGLGWMLHIAGPAWNAIHPQLMASNDAIEIYDDRLLTYALALVEAERIFRKALLPAQ